MKKVIKPVSSAMCMECKKHQKNCCNDAPRVPLTIEDVQRIFFLGFKVENFLIAGEYSKESLKNDEDDEDWWKNSAIKIKDKLYKINTKKKKDGSCFFLKNGVGCVLGKFRPAVCKIYPFWVNSKKEIIYEPGEKEYCYLGKLDTPILKGLKLIHEDKKKIYLYFNKIKNDCVNNKLKAKKILMKILK